MNETTKLLSLIVGIALISGFGVWSITNSNGGGVSEERVIQLVKEYIDENPAAIIASVENMQRKEADQQIADARERVKERIGALANNPIDPIAGNPNGDVTVVEFFDYACGYCKRAFKDLNRLIKEDKNVKVVLKEFPILGPNSLLASKAALGVLKMDRERYFDFHQALMETRVNGMKSINAIAKKLNIDATKLAKEMESDEVKRQLDANIALARFVGVRGTPAFVVGEEFVPGALGYQALKELVNAQRKINDKSS